MSRSLSMSRRARIAPSSLSWSACRRLPMRCPRSTVRGGQPAEAEPGPRLASGEVSPTTLNGRFARRPSKRLWPLPLARRYCGPGEVSLDELERAFRETSVEAVTVLGTRNRLRPSRFSLRRRLRLLLLRQSKAGSGCREGKAWPSTVAMARTWRSRTSRSASTSIRSNI